MARVLGESLAQLLARPATRDTIGRNILVEGIAEGPPTASSPWSAMLMRFSLALESGESLAKLLFGGRLLRLHVIHLPGGIVEEQLCLVL
jgi:hypothetical protein